MAIKTYKRGDNAKLSANFRVSEFLCHGSGCCTSGKIDDDLVKILQKIRDHFGKPVHISSAYRCAAWNKKVGGVSGSYHLSGRAADIKVEDTKPKEVAKYAESIGVLGIGLYETDKDGHFVHVDTRTSKSFWYGQKQEKRTTFGGAPEDKPTTTTAKTEVCTVEVKILRKGDEGSQVKAMQTLLIGYGYSCGGKGADGDFGSKTDIALQAYQNAKSLTPDGICGAKTWAKLLGMN